MTTDARQNKKLTNIQVFKLYSWLEQKIIEEAFEFGVSAAGVAVVATASLGFDVNANHIQGGLEQMGLKLPRGPISSDTKLGILKRAVETLYKKLGEQLPPEWSDL